MPTSPRSQRATEFQCTPMRAASCCCVSPSPARICRNSVPVMGCTIQIGYATRNGLQSGDAVLFDVGAKVTEPDPHPLPRQANPRKSRWERAYLQLFPRLRKGQETVVARDTWVGGRRCHIEEFGGQGGLQQSQHGGGISNECYQRVQRQLPQRTG